MRSVAVVGTGLIGTSVALALRGQGVTAYLLDRDPEAARAAEGLGAGIAEIPRAPVDLAVIAVPPMSTAAVLREYQLRGLASFFTDVASVKSGPQDTAAELGCDLTRYVGGHPMAGREQSGPYAARADLFRGRPWVLAPSRHSRADALEHATRLAELCGAHPLVMAHSEHDRAVALISHAPHLVSSLLAARLLDGEESQLRLAGQGLRDVTRIAAGDVGLWSDILTANSPAVAEVLTELAKDLDLVRAALLDLSDGDAQERRDGSLELTAALTRGVRGHARIPERTVTMNAGRLDVCLVGAGPRGLSVLERLCANVASAASGTPVTVHVVDPYPPGAGKVWRTDQSEHLLMNTVASQVTMFTDESVLMDGPLVPGPSLYEWARFLTLMGPLDDAEHNDTVLAEARALGPDSYPSRAFYGSYLEWVFRRVTRTAPGRLTTVVHRSRAVALGEETPDGHQSVRLEDGTRIDGLHAVVLSQGHLPVRRSAEQSVRADFAKTHELSYVAPANPADVDLSSIRSGETVALVGLGLNFFDYMALFTLGRGGRFVRREDRLSYLPSGREPRMVACSRRGLPFHSRGENQKGPHGRHTPVVLTPDVVAGLRRRAEAEGGLDFRSELWPLISKEVETVYYAALLVADGRAAEAEALRTAYLAAPAGPQEGRVLDAAGIAPEDRWDWGHIAHPYLGRHFASPEEFQSWLLDHLRGDLDAARAGNVDGPLKAALDVLRDLRNEVRLVVDHGGLTGRSHRDDLDGWYTPLNAFLSIGPPARRIEEAVALIEAGLLRVIGPEVRIGIDDEVRAFTVESDAVPGSRLHATALVEARLPEIDLRSTADPLLLQLLADGQCRPYTIGGRDGDGEYRTGGLAVSGPPFHILGVDDRAHPRRFAFGVPTESVHWATAAGIRPGVSSVTLQDSDAIARAVLSLAEGSPAEPRTAKAVAR